MTLQLDTESQQFLSLMADQEKLRAGRVPGVKTVLIVLSSAGMVFDTEALRHHVTLTYAGATVYFRTTDGKPVGPAFKGSVDLLIDFTGPRQKQGIFYAKTLRRIARVAAGRNAGFFRKKIYDRVFDEKSQAATLPTEMLRKERVVQKAVLASVGVALTQAGARRFPIAASSLLWSRPNSRSCEGPGMKPDKKNFADRLFGTLSSLKLAVVVTSSLAVALAAGTILESAYDTPTSQYMVYRSHWFHFVLALLGVNIFFVMVSRWPWKKRHAPFLVAHIGILMLLGGSWVTEQFGLDGSLRVAEGETQNVVELDEAALVLTEGEQARKVLVPWLPPDKTFKPISVKAQGLPYDLTIDQFITHADPSYSFIPAAKEDAVGKPSRPAVKLKLEGGPMNIVQEFWLWTGDPSFQMVSMGPARLAIIKPDGAPLKPVAGRTDLTVVVPDGDSPEDVAALKLLAHASDGTASDFDVRGTENPPKVFTPKNWKGGIRITVLEYVPNASVLTTYHPARIQYGQGAPTSAIHVITGRGGPGSETWLGLGDRAVMHLPGEKGGGGREVNLGYLPKRVVLPFAVKLDRFRVERYQGTIDPSSYSSLVSVTQGTKTEQTLISMNEPLTAQGITLYQASYEDAQPRPTVSILSVNRDPGRIWKYLGSILLVSGSIFLFASKYRRAKPAPASSGVST